MTDEWLAGYRRGVLDYARDGNGMQPVDPRPTVAVPTSGHFEPPTIVGAVGDNPVFHFHPDDPHALGWFLDHLTTVLAEHRQLQGIETVHPTAPCPCGSGKQYRDCHADTPQPIVNVGGFALSAIHPSAWREPTSFDTVPIVANATDDNTIRRAYYLSLAAFFAWRASSIPTGD